MADDAKYGAPQPSGGAGLDLSNPWVKWGGVAALGIAAYWFFIRRRPGAQVGGLSDGTTVSPTSTDGSGNVAWDPSTGLPIAGGGTNIGSLGSPLTDINAWTSNAYKALAAAGVAPTAAEQALYDFLNGNPLTTAEQGLVDKALGVAGQPPGGPFPVTTTPPPAPVIKTVTTPLSAIQQYVNGVYAYLHRNTKTYKGPVYTAAQIALAEKDVTTGKAALPGGFTAPKGYVLNPTTRILTKAS